MKALSVKQAFSKTFDTFDFTGVWADVMGNPENTGIWYIGG